MSAEIELRALSAFRNLSFPLSWLPLCDESVLWLLMRHSPAECVSARPVTEVYQGRLNLELATDGLQKNLGII
jgi:hypothetical protein